MYFKKSLSLVFTMVYLFIISHEIIAATQQLPDFVFKEHRPWQKICYLDSSIFLTVLPQIHIPMGKGMTWGNFRYSKNAKVKHIDNGFIYTNDGFFKKNIKNGQNSLAANIKIRYNIEVSKEGIVKCSYIFTNAGDDIFIEPYCNVKLTKEWVSGKKIKIERANEKIFTSKFSSAGTGTSVNWRSGQPRDPQVLGITINDKDANKVTVTVPSNGHIRLQHSDMHIYNLNHFASHLSKKPYTWKVFKANTTFAINFTIRLPLEELKSKKPNVKKK